MGIRHLGGSWNPLILIPHNDDSVVYSPKPACLLKHGQCRLISTVFIRPSTQVCYDRSHLWGFNIIEVPYKICLWILKFLVYILYSVWDEFMKIIVWIFKALGFCLSVWKGKMSTNLHSRMLFLSDIWLLLTKNVTMMYISLGPPCERWVLIEISFLCDIYPYSLPSCTMWIRAHDLTKFNDKIKQISLQQKQVFMPTDLSSW